MEHFEKLNKLNVNEYVEKKKSGKTELPYLSWANAWAETKKIYPDATYKILKFENNLPYIYDDRTGYMVFTEVTIEGITHEMWLPVIDGANKAMLSKPQTYKVKEYNFSKPTGNMIEKQVEVATMFDINKTIMRCLTKNLAMFGLGLYIYAGEDLPDGEEPTKQQSVDAKNATTEKQENQKYDAISRLKQCKTLKELQVAYKEDYPNVYNKKEYIKLKDEIKKGLENNE